MEIYLLFISLAQQMFCQCIKKINTQVFWPYASRHTDRKGISYSCTDATFMAGGGWAVTSATHASHKQTGKTLCGWSDGWPARPKTWTQTWNHRINFCWRCQTWDKRHHVLSYVNNELQVTCMNSFMNSYMIVSLHELILMNSSFSLVIMYVFTWTLKLYHVLMYMSSQVIHKFGGTKVL